MSDFIWAQGYLVVEPVESQHGNITSAKFAKVTGREPHMEGSQRAVKVRLRLPVSVFKPIVAVDVHVPEGDIVVPLVEVVTPE